MMKTVFMKKEAVKGIEILELERWNVFQSLKEAILNSLNYTDNYDIEIQDIVSISYNDEKVNQDLLTEGKVSMDEAEIQDVSNADIENDVKNKIAEYLNADESCLRALAVSLGYGMETTLAAMNSESKNVVIQLAKRKYKLYVLKDCTQVAVRAEVAKYAFADELIKENNDIINQAIAETTDDENLISILATFEQSKNVRIALAKRDIRSDLFVNDIDISVLCALAENTKNRSVLVILLNDEHDRVRDAALNNPYIIEQDCLNALEVNENNEFRNNRYIRITIAKQALKNNWVSVWKILAKDGAEEVRMELANAGVMKEVFLKDSSSAIRHAAYLASMKEEN